MKQKKSLILIIAVLVLILILGCVYAYFGTDLLKGNKELFFKYLTQTVDEKNSFIEGSLKQYSEKKKNTPYTDQGAVSVNISAENGQNQFENTNRINFTFEGQVNNPENQMKQDFSLNYSDSVKVPFSFKKVGDLAGIQYSKFGKSFIVLDLKSDNSSIKGFDETQKVQDLTTLPFNEEEARNTLNSYFDVLNQELKDSSFSKINDSNGKGYKLTLKGEDLKNIAVKLLEKLKNDQTTLDKINEYLKKQKNSLKITLSNIENEIENINNNQEINNKNIEISVYQSKRKTNQLIVKIDDIELKIIKVLTGNDLQYNLELQQNSDDNNLKFGLIAKFQGLQAMQSISENYELTLGSKDITYKYNLNNNVEFVQGTDIENFDDQCLNLSKLEKEQKAKIIAEMLNRLQKANKKQMSKLGLSENENPLQYVIPTNLLSYGALNTSKSGSMNEEEITAFNERFEAYESTNLKGVTVKGLLTTIGLNNEAQEFSDRKIKEIHFEGEEYEANEQNITIIKGNVEIDKEYRVEFEKDEDTRSNLQGCYK